MTIKNKSKEVFVKKIRKKVSAFIVKHSMIEKDDRILIGFSGGKDSIVLLDILNNIKKKVNFNFEIFSLMIGNSHIELSKFNDVELKILEFVPVNIKREKNSYCHICSRIRRGTLYEYASLNGFNKIALGHHLDDVIETYFLNQFYQSKLETMKPIYKAQNSLMVIRPMHFLPETDIIKYFEFMNFKKLNTVCPFGVTKTKRSYIKNLLKELSDIEKYNIYHSLETCCFN